MGKQIENFKLNGSIGDLTFYKSRHGLLVRRKGGITKSRVLTESNFVRTRENNAEFGTSAKAGKILRQAFLPYVQKAKDPDMVARIVKEIYKVVKSDSISPRGLRNMINAEVQLLRGFNFNDRSHLSTTLKISIIDSIDRSSGNMSISLPSFSPIESIEAPMGTTHYKIVSAGGEIDFANNNSVVNMIESALLPYNSTPSSPLSLQVTVSPNSLYHLFLIGGVQFFQFVNGNAYSLSNGEFNALSIVSVEKA